ncbi:MAG: DeoR/GlpR family transcriptional regulator of sugar metabolism [Flavobacteriales bacterium]|jgi:DeoR/GlpR family transcriptional regulator of sugar metabolism
MEKRNTAQRRRNITEYLQQVGEASVDTLAKRFNTSEVTIRKDLGELENTGFLVRRHGGALLIPKEHIAESQNPEISKRKLAIAKAAVDLIRDHNRVIIDSGQTTSAMLGYLEQLQGLVVMTNSLQVAQNLLNLENEPTVLMTGGTWDKRSESFQGQVAEKVLREYDFDQLFIGADGLDLERGTCTYNELVGLSRTMAEVAREVIVVAESNKLNRRIPNQELAWTDINILVTDSELDEQAKQQLTAQSVRVIQTY